MEKYYFVIEPREPRMDILKKRCFSTPLLPPSHARTLPLPCTHACTVISPEIRSPSTPSRKSMASPASFFLQ